MKLGSTFSPTDTFATRFASGRGDGAAAYRYLRFDERVDGFVYYGGLHKM